MKIQLASLTKQETIEQLLKLLQTTTQLGHGADAMFAVEAFEETYDFLENYGPIFGPQSKYYVSETEEGRNWEDYWNEKIVQTKTFETSDLFDDLTMSEKVSYWEMANTTSTLRSAAHTSRFSMELLLENFINSFELSDNMKTALFHRRSTNWVLAQWYYDTHTAEEIEAFRVHSKILDEVRATRNPKISCTAVMGIILDSPHYRGDGRNDFILRLDKRAITSRFATTLVNNLDRLHLDSATVVACLRIAYDIDESVPDGWVEHAFI